MDADLPKMSDLIDSEFCSDTIEVTFSAGISRPLKLTSPEARRAAGGVAGASGGVVDPQAACSAYIAKICRGQRHGGRRTGAHRKPGRRGRYGPPVPGWSGADHRLLRRVA